MNVKNLNWLWLSVVIIAADQFTKHLIKQNMVYGTGEYITSFFNVVHARNYGAGFSFLDNPGGYQRWIFSLISLAVSVVLIVWLSKLRKDLVWRKLALACIIGGALGNLYGRFFKGYVVDFLAFHIGNYHWPAFNIADSAVCIGAFILIVGMIWGKK